MKLISERDLPLSPNAPRRLLVTRGVPVGVEQHKPISADEVDTAAASLAAEQKDKGA